jgi:hypothetical protein
MASDAEFQDTDVPPEDGFDLFDFDELIEGAEEVADELSSELDAALEESSPELATPIDDGPAAHAPRADIETANEATSLDERGHEVRPQLRHATSALASTPPPARKTRISIGATTLVIMMIANVALVGLTWKSLDTTQDLIAAGVNNGVAETSAPVVPPTSIETSEPAEAASTPAPREPMVQVEVEDPPLEAYSALFDAETALGRGEYRRARRALFGLLTVIDRIPEAERVDVEAKAGLLVAEAYRLEAAATGDGS